MKQLLTPLVLAAATGLPVYPGATHVMDMTNEGCKTKITTVTYRLSGPSWQSVVDWYRSRLAGTISVTMPAGTKGVELFTPDGRGNVAVAEANSKTVFALNAFDPPLPSNRIADIAAARRGDASAQARLKAACGQDYQP